MLSSQKKIKHKKISEMLNSSFEDCFKEISDEVNMDTFLNNLKDLKEKVVIDDFTCKKLKNNPESYKPKNIFKEKEKRKSKKKKIFEFKKKKC